MKRIALVAGIILTLVSLISILQYAPDYAQLSTYGKGFIWGKLLLLALGIGLIVFGGRKQKS